MKDAVPWEVMPWGSVRTHVSKEHVAFNFRVEKISELGRTLTITSRQFLRNIGSNKTHTTPHPRRRHFRKRWSRDWAHLHAILGSNVITKLKSLWHVLAIFSWMEKGGGIGLLNQFHLDLLKRYLHASYTSHCAEIEYWTIITLGSCCNCGNIVHPNVQLEEKCLLLHLQMIGPH
jgi:hypothetical protein